MAQLYATNALSGVVVDIGLEKTDVTPIYDGFIARHACDSISLGVQDCQNYLAHLLRSNQSLVATLSPPETPLSSADLQSTLVDLVRLIWEKGHVKVPSDGETVIVEDEGVTDIAAVVMAGREKAVVENAARKKSNAKGTATEQARARELEAMDLLTIEFRGHNVTIGKERHRFCEPLFDPTLLNSLPAYSGVSRDGPDGRSIQELVGQCVRLNAVDHRQYIWHALSVTGDLTRHMRGVFSYIYAVPD